MKFFEINYKSNGFYSSVLIKADAEDTAIDFYKKRKANVEIISVGEIINIQEFQRKGIKILNASS